MAKKRWENKTPEEKSLHGKKMRQARTEKESHVHKFGKPEYMGVRKCECGSQAF